ncbi:DUF1802 family protein [Aerosakkonema funiforme]|uniref:DUF1802 family protein n=1 Tax=Aerosakkonema funiforme TaxID=1246630 RepID=UPI0035B97A20
MTIHIVNGIQLPAFDVEMLSLGKLIAVSFKQHIKDGQVFWIYPSQNLPDALSIEQYYQPEYLNYAESSFAQNKTQPLQIKAWARCEYHWRINPDQKHLLPKIAKSNIWNLSALEQIFNPYQVLKLLILRVYRLPQPCIVNQPTEAGNFYWPKSEDSLTTASQNDSPVIYNASFNKRKTVLLAGEVYPYTTLESLQLQLEQMSSENLDTKLIKHDFKQVLGWSSDKEIKQTEPDWINQIAEKGNRSKEEDDPLSNHAAGTAFEDIVRQSLEFLGFTVDYAHRGGAGGLDLFCSKPFSLVGECKAGKKIPNDTAVQLLNLGTIRLSDKEAFNQAAKLIIGPGEPTDQLKKAAKVHGMAIIRPETLEKLVKLHSNHRGSVDLFKLKKYLIEGQADEEVEKYIKQAEQEIKLRSYIIKLVKKYLENANSEDAGIYELHAVYVVSNPPQPLKREDMQEILIELSSPLAGYLGRKKGNDWQSDRFYYLRDLIIENI